MKLDRRDFLKLGAVASVGSLMGTTPARGAEPAATGNVAGSGKQRMIWGNLLHLGTNMWCDWDAPELKGGDSVYRPELRFDRSLWDDLLKKMQQAERGRRLNRQHAVAPVLRVWHNGASY